MALVQSPSPEFPSDGSGAAQLQNVHQLHPPQHEGLFLPEHYQDNIRPLPPALPQYETVADVSRTEHIETIRHPGLGTIWRDQWYMSDGVGYKVSIGRAERSKTDIAIVNETPLITQTKGYNEDVGLSQLQLGYDFVLVGPEEGAEIPLSHSAHNTHAILDVLLKQGYFNEEWIALYGFSRGAEISFGNAAYADQHGRKILYAHLVDPYGAAPLEFSREQIEEFTDVAFTEATTAIQAVGTLLMNPLRAWHYRHSIDISLEGAKQFVRTAKSVLSGEAGELAYHFPDEAQGTVLFFGKKDGRRRRLFEEALAGKPGLEFAGIPRGHLVNMYKKVLGQTSVRFAGLAQQLGAGVKPEDIDFGLVHKPDLGDQASELHL